MTVPLVAPPLLHRWWRLERIFGFPFYFDISGEFVAATRLGFCGGADKYIQAKQGGVSRWMLCIGKMTITPKWSYNLIKLHLSHAITLSANQECLVNAAGIIKKIGQTFPHSCYGLGF
jgi:hypothetical protein